MDFKTFLLIIIGSALANNVVLEQFFGVTPALGAKGSAKALAKYGLAVAAVTLVAALCTAGISIGVYSTFVAALWVLIAASVIGHFFTDKYLLIALNGVVFGTCANAASSGLAEATASALGAGLGFTVALLLFVGIPLPGTGAWTGTLAGSILDMKFKDVLVACMGGVLLAGIIMGLASAGLLGALSGLFAVG